MLSPAHQEHLLASGLSLREITARGYQTLTRPSEVLRLGFSRPQAGMVSADTPTLLIPLWDARGERAGYQHRPDVPRINRGRVVKYEFPADARMVVDVPPGAREWLGDPAVPLWITEGVKKADAAVAHGVCCLCLLGVDCWRGKNEVGGRTVLPVFETVGLNGREVYIAFDSDVAQKDSVFQPFRRLWQFLESRGAKPRAVYLDGGPQGQKVGLDDYLAAGGGIEPLRQAAAATLRVPPHQQWTDEPDARSLYQMTSHGLYWVRSGDQPRVRLTNFEAWVTGVVTRDDGQVRTRTYEVEAQRNGEDRRRWAGRVPATAFASMEWVADTYAEWTVFPTARAAAQAEVAIRLLSEPIPERTVYTHLGWRLVGDRWVYLHAGGAIGADGEVPEIEVEPEADLGLYRLPPVAGPEAQAEAVRRSLGFLELGDRAQLWPLYAAVWTAPLASLLHTDFVVWLYGPTGSRKSTIAALALAHYGPFERHCLPANFLGTGNALEVKLFFAKDALLVVDNFVPGSSPRDQAAQDMVAHRLLHSVGDGGGRARATRDGGLQESRSPRGLALATAELPPPGQQSSEARTLEVAWDPEGVDLTALARAGRQDRDAYAQALAGYVQWLASQRIPEATAVRQWALQQRDTMPEAHGRLRESAGKLMAGAAAFLRYAAQLGAITPETLGTLLAECRAALEHCVRETGAHQEERRPTALFLELLRAMLAQGAAYLADREHGGAPEPEPRPWGWQLGYRDGMAQYELRSGAEKLGWVDLAAGRVYLLPTASARAVTGYAARMNILFPASPRALGDALLREGLLCETNTGRRDLRIHAEGGIPTVWALRVETVTAPSDGGTRPKKRLPSPSDSQIRSSGEGVCLEKTGDTHTQTPDGVALANSGGEPANSGGEPAVCVCTLEFGGLQGPQNCESANQTLSESVEWSGGVDSGSEASKNEVHVGAEGLDSPAKPSGTPGEWETDDSQNVGEFCESSANPANPASPEPGETPRDSQTDSQNSPRDSQNSAPPANPAPSEPAPARGTWVMPEYEVITKPADLGRVRESLETCRVVGLDVETYGPGRDGALDPRRGAVRLLQLATPAKTWVVDCSLCAPEPLWPVLRGRMLVGHHLAFDLGFLWQRGFRPGKVEDTMLLTRLLSAGMQTARGYHGLEQTTQRLLGVDLPKTEQRSDWSGRLTGEQLQYAARDAAVLLPLRRALWQWVEQADLVRTAALECRALPALVWLSAAGVPLDAARWRAIAEMAATAREQIRTALDTLVCPPPQPQASLGLGESYAARWNWDSPEQMERALHSVGVRVPNTRDETLSQVDHPLAALCREYRGVSKRLTSFGLNFLERVRDGRIYPGWQQTGAHATGRMTCEEPNFQQIPRAGDYRACVAAPAGRVLVKADYSQIELRIAAQLTQDEALLEAYRAGEDLHTVTARRMLGTTEVTKAQRQIAKSANFGLLYGMGAEGFQAYAQMSYGVEMSLDEARRMRNAWFAAYPGVRAWHAAQTPTPENTVTRTGRRRLGVVRFTEKLNTPVQGTGADGLKRALGLLWERRLGEEAFPVLVCHDEIVVECAAGDVTRVELWLRQAMLDGMQPLLPDVPVEVDVTVGPTWAG